MSTNSSGETQVLFGGLVNGNTKNMKTSSIYCRIGKVYAVMLGNPLTIYQEWGQQDMPHGSFMLIDPGNQNSPVQVWGIERKSFVDTYEAVLGEPGWYRKTAKIRAVQMDHPFFVKSLDSDEPEVGQKGDWLVENIRPDGTESDRYLIRKDRFDGMYEHVKNINSSTDTIEHKATD